MTRVFDDESNQPDDGSSSEPITPSPGLGPSTRMQVVIAALTGGVVGWFVISTLVWVDKVVPVTPWTMSLMVVVVAVAAAICAKVLKTRLDDDRAQVSTEQALMALVVGKTMVFTGALLAGGHLVYVVMNLGQWALPMPRDRVIFGTLAVLSSACFAAAGWLLERACRVS